MQPSHTKRPGGICDRSSEDRSDVLGTHERPALRIKVAINTATVKECPMPFRHPASSLHPWSVMTHEFRLIFFFASPFRFFFSNPRDFFPDTVYGIVFFGSQLASQCNCSWKSIRVGRRLGMDVSECGLFGRRMRQSDV